MQRRGLGMWTWVSPKAARVPMHPHHLRCQQVRQVLQPLKVLWKLIQRSPNLSKENSAPLLVFYETRWNQVVLTEVLFEVWCDFQRSKNKTWGVRSNRSYEKLCSTLGETKPERPQSHREQSHTSLPQHLTCCTNIRQRAWQNLHPLNEEVIWVTQPPGREL